MYSFLAFEAKVEIENENHVFSHYQDVNIMKSQNKTMTKARQKAKMSNSLRAWYGSSLNIS